MVWVRWNQCLCFIVDPGCQFRGYVNCLKEYSGSPWDRGGTFLWSRAGTAGLFWVSLTGTRKTAARWLTAAIKQTANRHFKKGPLNVNNGRGDASSVFLFNFSIIRRRPPRYFPTSAKQTVVIPDFGQGSYFQTFMFIHAEVRRPNKSKNRVFNWPFKRHEKIHFSAVY